MEDELMTVGEFNEHHIAASAIAERSLIGAALLNPTATFECTEGIVTSSDFRDGELARVWKVLTAMHNEQEPIDDVSFVAIRLRSVGLLDALGGIGGIARLAEVAMPHHAVYYATEIRRYSRISAARDAAIAILAECEKPDCRLVVVSEIAAKRLLGLSSAMELIEAMRVV